MYDFLIDNDFEGPRGRLILKEDVELGDIIQLSFSNGVFGHSLIVTSLENNQIRICAHTIDSRNRLLDTYNYEDVRYIKIQ